MNKDIFNVMSVEDAKELIESAKRYPKNQRKSHSKSRNGCARCKSRHIKCDEKRPYCGRCLKAGLKCAYRNITEPPFWNCKPIDPKVCSISVTPDGKRCKEIRNAFVRIVTLLSSSKEHETFVIEDDDWGLLEDALAGCSSSPSIIVDHRRPLLFILISFCKARNESFNYLLSQSELFENEDAEMDKTDSCLCGLLHALLTISASYLLSNNVTCESYAIDRSLHSILIEREIKHRRLSLAFLRRSLTYLQSECMDILMVTAILLSVHSFTFAEPLVTDVGSVEDDVEWIGYTNGNSFINLLSLLFNMVEMIKNSPQLSSSVFAQIVVSHTKTEVNMQQNSIYSRAPQLRVIFEYYDILQIPAPYPLHVVSNIHNMLRDLHTTSTNEFSLENVRRRKLVFVIMSFPGIMDREFIESLNSGDKMAVAILYHFWRAVEMAGFLKRRLWWWNGRPRYELKWLSDYLRKHGWQYLMNEE
ncbi:hypothetical protein V1511DRAFT_509759 [Dipodascopsis uninucleata]